MKSAGIRSAHRRPAARLLRKLGWNRAHGTVRRRVYDLAVCHYPWWDWGHRLVIVVGRDWGGSWDEPQPPTWWYRLGPPKPMAFTRWPRHPLSTFEIVTDYDEFRRRTEGLNEDQMYEWKAIGANQDGDLHLGHQYWGGSFYGVTRWERALLRRYLRRWNRSDWWGLRTWLWGQGLNASVHRRKPFACNEVPPKGAGGYNHWHCELKRRHDGMHRFGAYVWGEIDGEPIGAHVPEAMKSGASA